ncbi:MAG: hypothetical protein K8W52_36585 [Deltaproteobacteria bacterium]|nr:hypothetical protein [Deltaproteobacteria bacterium]
MSACGADEPLDVPQVISAGGPVLAHPVVVPIFFAGDEDMQAMVEPFLAALPGSDYWAATTREYGIGDLRVGPTIVASEAPPTTGDELEAWLRTMLDGAHPGWPAPTADAIYTVYLPAGATLTSSFGTSCVGFGGYHGEIAIGDTKVAYALVARCQSSVTSDLDFATMLTSHELVEAASDPYYRTAPAYLGFDDDYAVWSVFEGVELSDLCEDDRAEVVHLGAYPVERSWSNRSMREGHSPCVPVPQRSFARAVPDLPDHVGDVAADQVLTRGVSIPAGTSRTIEVRLHADGATADWQVKARDLAASVLGQSDALSFSWDRDTGHAGDVLHLTITHLRSGTHPFSLWSVGAEVTEGTWYGMVGD